MLGSDLDEVLCSVGYLTMFSRSLDGIGCSVEICRSINFMLNMSCLIDKNGEMPTS